MSPQTKALLKAIPALAVFCLLFAVALVAVFATLQVLAPSLGNVRAYVEQDAPTFLLTLAALVGVTYVFKYI